MDKNQQNLEFLNEIISLVADTTNLEKAEQMMYEYLLRNTTGGKLYKYCSFSSEHTISNFESNILHCSSPVVFNDPFDPKIGVSFESISKALCAPFMHSIEESLNEYETEHGKNLYANSDDADKQKLVLNLLETVFGEDSLGEVAGPLKEIADNFVEKVSSEDQNSISGPLSMSEAAKLLGLPDNVDDIDLIEPMTAVLLPSNMGKALEYKQKLIECERYLSNVVDEKFRIGCLTTAYDNRLMWSHYADSYTGICLEYDLSKVPKGLLVLPVFYSDTRPELPWENLNDQTPENQKTAMEKIMLGLLMKDKVWQYENEWRVMVFNKEPENLKIPITAIYLGAKINQKNRAKVLEIAKKNNIPVKQMKLDRGKYELHFGE